MKRRPLYLLFAFNSFAAAMVALYIGFAIGLPRPYWAMTTAYIVSQPLSGAVRSKGVYRIIGTALGAGAALAMVPAFYDSPEILSLALALWVAFCLYMSLLDRTPRSYVFLLAGFTAAIVAFPVAPDPITIFDVTVARCEEISLGVICATVFHSLVFPQAVGPALNQRIQVWTRDARRWAVEVLEGQDPAAHDQERRKLAADIIDIRILSTQLPFDTSNFKETSRLIRAMQDRMSMLLPLMSAVGDRLRLLRAENRSPPELEAILTEMETWLADLDGARPQAEVLIKRLDALFPKLGENAPWCDLVLENLLDRLGQFIRTVADIRDLRHAVEAGSSRMPATLDQSMPLSAGAGLHRDHYLAFLSGLAVAVAILGCCALWIGLSWPEGSVAALSAAIFCSFFAFQDDPAPTISMFLTYIYLSIPIVAAYQFAILPRIDGFPMLVLALAPAFLTAGYFIAQPKTSLRALALVLGMCNGLALAEYFSPSFAGFANTNIAQVVGLLAALIATQLCRSVGATWSARRILRTGWREIASVAEATRPIDRTALAVRMLDRVGLLASRLSNIDPQASPTAADALSDVRVSLNIEELHNLEGGLAGVEGP
ncbi:MAG: FUSC family protein, partial [Caulobacteraceae bacterium]